MASIQKPVGLKCKNDIGDVIVIQLLLNKFIVPGCLGPMAQLLPDGKFGNQTAEAIYAFQNGILGWKKPDMRIDPGGTTLGALNGPLKWANAPGGTPVYPPSGPPAAPEEVTWGDPIVITAMDSIDRASWRVKWGDVSYFIDPTTMVANVLKVAGHAPISRLYVLSHGYYDGVGNVEDTLNLRNDSITVQNFDSWEPTLRKLSPHFSDHGDVVLLACYVGGNEPLLRKLAKTFNATVYGGTSYTWMGTGHQTGRWMRCTPTGAIDEMSPHPSTLPKHPKSPFWSGLY